MTPVIAFDVNETLLDLSALDADFEELLGSASIRAQWFAQMLQLSFVGGLTGEYVDFTTAQHAALSMLAQRTGRGLTAHNAARIVDRMSSLPPHPEVVSALEMLRNTPLRAVALTNSVARVAQAQLLNAGIATTSTKSSLPIPSDDSNLPLSRTELSQQPATSTFTRYDSSPRTPGTFPVPCPPAARRHSSRVRAWCLAQLVANPTSSEPTSPQ